MSYEYKFHSRKATNSDYRRDNSTRAPPPLEGGMGVGAFQKNNFCKQEQSGCSGMTKIGAWESHANYTIHDIMTDIPTTLDGILNHRVTLEQPASGYRIAVDTILLAAAVPALAGDRILDMGCGVGGAMLSLACRVAGVTASASKSNPISPRSAAAISNVMFSPPASMFGTAMLPNCRPISHGLFDHALINPPYHEEARHDVSPDAIKRTANTEKDRAIWVCGSNPQRSR